MRPVRPTAFAGAFPVGAGHRTPATLLAIDERDRYLREAADRFCIGMKDRPAAAMLHSKLLLYRSGAWRRDESENLCPTRHKGTINELLWMTLKANDHVPSEMTIRRALGYS
jgi:hypothetical protein